MALVLAGGWIMAAISAGAAMIIWRAHAAMLESVARAAHELRGPLTAARLGLQLTVGGGDLSRARVRAVELELGRATLALADLAESGSQPGLGNGARGRPGRRALVRSCMEYVDLEELLGESVEAWRGFAVSRGVELRLIGASTLVPAFVQGDRLRLAQATGNLIANAIEHGAGDVVVRCRRDADQVRVEVTDGGVGLPAPVAELVRRPRGGRGTRGRGLAIAAEVAAGHGGRLAAGPADAGARVVLELPRAGGRSGAAGLPRT